MTDDRIAAHLDTIYEAAVGAPEVIGDLTSATFLASRTAKLAGVMTLVIIGEAAARLLAQHPHYVSAHPEVPWQAIRNMRNRGVHGYDGMNFSTVWDTLNEDLPILAEQIHSLLQEFGGPLPPPQTGT